MAAIIALMGIDGSGKSSLGRAVCEKLTARGDKAVFVWASLRPVLLKPFIKLAKYMLVRKHDKFKDYEKHMSVKRAGMKKLGWMHGIYFFVMMIDYIPQVIYKVAWPRLCGKHVICDRYYHDLMLDYCAQVNAPADKVVRLVNLCGKLLPAPDLTYLVHVSPEVAMSRKTDIPAQQYLEDRMVAYQEVIKAISGNILDGTLSLDENSDVILEGMANLEH